MESFLSPLDLFIFFVALVTAMAIGLIAGRKEETSEDYFLAGRKIPWFGVAGSIFGSNVSANHMVGMMGIGFSIGFAQSHFELGAIFGLLMLCYGFLPVYRRMNIFTLSQYLGDRYDERSRITYAIVMIVIMAFVQMVPGLYIGARSMCVLMGGDAVEEVTIEVALPSDAEVAAEDAPAEDARLLPVRKQHVNFNYYVLFVLALAVISASYTILGGLKAVIWTDVIQSVLLLLAGILVALLTFNRIGGWGQMMKLDRADDGLDKMHLYLPMDHPELPWTGVFTGLMAMHMFYWGTNQFIVQRALGARSNKDARIGIIAAGYLKLLIPFFAIGAGVAAVYLFRQEFPDRHIAPDTAFAELVKLVVLPIGYGIIGVIAAGLIGAILSSIDSMMNSAATIFTIDVYKRYLDPEASERRLILIGRVTIVVLVIVAAALAILVLDPNSEKNFFLQIADYQNHLTPGILVAFLVGMFWKRGTGTGAFTAIIAGFFFSWLVVYAYDTHVGAHPAVYNLVVERQTLATTPVDDLPDAMRAMTPSERLEHVAAWRERLASPLPLFGSRLAVTEYLGPRLNFFHRVVFVILLCLATHVIVSLLTKPNETKSRLTWTDMGGHEPRVLRQIVGALLVSIGLLAILGWLMVQGVVRPPIAGLLGAAWTLSMFVGSIVIAPRQERLDGEAFDEDRSPLVCLLTDDRLWAGLLSALAVFMLYHYY